MLYDICILCFFSQLKTRMDGCESKATESRNEYILCMSAANAHQVRYFTTDLPNLIEVSPQQGLVKPVYNDHSQDNK